MRSRHRLPPTLLLSLVLPAVPLQAADPARLITQARERLEAGDCGAAEVHLGEALRGTAELENAATRLDAERAVRFYTAVVHSRCGDQDGARSELREFFRLQPGTSSLDPRKFDPAFVRLFGEVQREVAQPSTVATFARFYPGFENVPPGGLTPVSVLWGASSEFQLLATDRERDDWSLLADDSSRADFVTRFWQRRDAIPETEGNEYRTEIGRRVRFADQIFPASDERGALSDRGKVFVLLGVPSRVYRDSLQRGETTFVTRSIRRPLDGQIERWIYFRPQLPEAVPASQVEFRFITQPGYGEGVLQKDFLALKALEQARQAAVVTAE